MAPTYTGTMTLKTYLTPTGDARELAAAAPVTGITIDKTPVDAIGVLCQPTMVPMGGEFNLNLWYTQTHKR